MGTFIAAVLALTTFTQTATFTIAVPDSTAPKAFSSADLSVLPRESVTLVEDGEDVKYEGVRLTTLLERAGAPSGSAMRGAALTTYVLAEAKDNYKVLFSLGELDPQFGNAQIIVADKRNGRDLFDYQGPFRLIVAGDKRGARGVRMLTSIKLVRLPE